MSILKVKNLDFNYSDKQIIKNLSFSVEKGDFLCIVGTNGTGKSTLIKLILNLLKPDSGEILLYGKDSKNFKQFDKIAYVSQKATNFNAAFPATVEEVVSAGLYSKNGLFKFKKSTDKQQIKKALDTVGMYDFSKKLIGNLSGGQQQRVFIAKALVSSPEIIFLDEPTVGIDMKAVDSICCLLGDLNKKHKITIIMVTHDISSILYHANKVLNLSEDGHIRIISAEDYRNETISEHYRHDKNC